MTHGWIGLIGDYEEQRAPRNSLRNGKDPCILVEVRKRKESLHWRHHACSAEEGEQRYGRDRRKHTVTCGAVNGLLL